MGAEKTTEPARAINPANLPAERCVLGAMIEDDSLLPKAIVQGLRSDDFSLCDHRRIFAAIEMLRARKALVSYVSVAEQLGNSQEDYALIAGLVHGIVLHEGHLLHHVAIVRKKARLRRLLRLGEWILQAVTEPADPEFLVAQIREMLETCSESQIRA